MMLVDFRFPPGIYDLCNRGQPVSAVVVKAPESISIASLAVAVGGAGNYTQEERTK